MEATDTYYTIAVPAEATYTEKRSRFLAFAVPVTDAEQVRQQVAAFQKKYYDARHVCYAYVLGPEGADFRANDNGEPSGTAGRPILGQIRSHNLTDVLVVVVRYFGGIKLGTSGLYAAYKTAAGDCLQAAAVVQKTVEVDTACLFDYAALNDVMRVAKDLGAAMLDQSYTDTQCRMTLRIRKDRHSQLLERLGKIQSFKLVE